MNSRRRSLVEQAFRILDKDGSGIVDGDDIARNYNAKQHPDVLSKRRTEKQVLEEFLSTFEKGGTIDGKVCISHFQNNVLV
jgi:hypothetical protein